jgi:hypothetical protein
MHRLGSFIAYDRTIKKLCQSQHSNQLSLLFISIIVAAWAASARDIAHAAAHIADMDHAAEGRDVAVHPPDMFLEKAQEAADIPVDMIGKTVGQRAADKGPVVVDRVGSMAAAAAAEYRPSCLARQIRATEKRLPEQQLSHLQLSPRMYGRRR